MCGFFKRICLGAAVGFGVMTLAGTAAFSATLQFLDAAQNFNVSASAQTTTIDNESNSGAFTALTPFDQTVSTMATAPAFESIAQATSTSSATVMSDLLPQSIQAFTGMQESPVFQMGSSSATGSGEASFSTDFTVDTATSFILDANLLTQPTDPTVVIGEQATFTLKDGLVVIATGSLDQNSPFPTGQDSFHGFLVPGSTYTLSLDSMANFSDASGPVNAKVMLRAVPVPAAVWTWLVTVAGIGVVMLKKKTHGRAMGFTK